MAENVYLVTSCWSLYLVHVRVTMNNLTWDAGNAQNVRRGNVEGFKDIRRIICIHDRDFAAVVGGGADPNERRKLFILQVLDSLLMFLGKAQKLQLQLVHSYAENLNIPSILGQASPPQWMAGLQRPLVGQNRRRLLPQWSHHP